MKKFRITLIGLIVAVSVYLLTILVDADVFESFASFVSRFEQFEIDEIIIPSFIFIVFAFIDALVRQREQHIQIEKNKIYKAMLLSSHHVLNNFLNQMQVIKISAEETKGFPKEDLALFDEIIDDASAKIKSLGQLEELSEKSIVESVHPDNFEKKRKRGSS